MPIIVDVKQLTAAQRFIIQGDEAGDRAGSGVSRAGDVNGDGVADFLVSNRDKPDGSTKGGKVYVIFGKSGTNRANIDLTALAPTDGFTVSGILHENINFSGTALSSAGDINGDGLDDFIIGAAGASVPIVNPYSNHNFSGLSYVIYGKAGATRANIDVAALSATDGFAIEGDRTGDRAGHSVSGAGDVNGDLIGDLIVGAPSGNNGGLAAGEAYIVFGKAGATRGNVNLSTFPSTEGFIVQGDLSLDKAGETVSSAGDVNGDGINDLLVGSRYSGNRKGETYVIYGKASTTRATIDLTTLSATDGFMIVGNDRFEESSYSLSSAGDINGDGFDDILIGAPRSTAGGIYAGEVYVIFGKAGTARATIDIASLAPADGFVIKGHGQSNYAGTSVSAAGDINGDGVDDIIIGTRAANGPGAAYVIFGATGATRSNINLESIADSDGYTIIGDANFDRFGKTVAGIGDINGDGKADLIIGAPDGDDGGQSAGEAYVLLGGTAGATVTTNGNDVLTNPVGFNRFDGGAGLDNIDMSNYTGTIILNTVDRTITSTEGGVASIDTYINIEFFTLGSGQNVVTIGDEGTVIRSGGGNDTITGGTGRDLVNGGGGNDTLSGGTGTPNELAGGPGNDTYILSAIGDSVIEALGEGIDEIQTALAVMVNRLNVETLRFTSRVAHVGVGDIHGETIIGNTGADELFGRGGNDSLRGGTGAANALFGGSGDDTYFVDAIGDSVFEAIGEGIDKVVTTLATHVLRDFVEELSFSGMANATGIGNASANRLTGASGADFLSGLDGDDVINGLAGMDLLIGGSGADTFQFTTILGGPDRIFDFVSGTDKIAVSFASITPTATIDYIAGTAATSINTTFLYNADIGILSLDPDGIGVRTPLALANVGGGATFTSGDFLFY